MAFLKYFIYVFIYLDEINKTFPEPCSDHCDLQEVIVQGFIKCFSVFYNLLNFSYVLI